MSGHVWDTLSGYCLRCGQSEHRILDKLKDCIPDTSNVIAISHHIAAKKRKRMVSLTLKRLTEPKDPA